MDGGSQTVSIDLCGWVSCKLLLHSQATVRSDDDCTIQESQPVVLGVFPSELNIRVHHIDVVCKGLYFLSLDFSPRYHLHTCTRGMVVFLGRR